MRLSPLGAELIVHTGLRADTPVTEMAALVRARVHRVRYELARLMERKVITPTALVDVFALGWQRIQLFLSIASRASAQRERFLEKLGAHPQVAFVADTAGDFDAEAVVLVRRLDEVTEILEETGCNQAVRLVGKAVAAHHNLTLFPRKYLSTRPPLLASLSIGTSSEQASIDSLDHNLLCAVVRSPQSSQRELAQLVGVSSVTVHARLQRLRASGVLKSFVWSVAGEAIGSHNFILLLETHGFDEALAGEVLQHAKRHPYCTNFRRALGNWDLEIGVEVPRVGDVLRVKDELSEKFFDRLSSVRVLNRIAIRKYRPYPFNAT